MNLSNKIIRRTFFNKLKNLFSPSTYTPSTPSPIIILDPERIDNNWKDDWISTSDKGYGGPSISELSIERIPINSELITFLRFQGSMNMTKQVAKDLGVVSGFCAFRGEVISSQVLDSYKGFEIICRSGIDTSVILNMTLNNKAEEDVFQVVFLID